MIQEDYCSFELSKLLKEKGFKEPCKGLTRIILSDSDKPQYKVTHQMAMKWLREEKGIMIITYVAHFDNLMENNSNSYFSEMFNLADDLEQMGNTGYYATYEEAVEAALKYSLENLI